MERSTLPLASPRLYVNCVADLDWLIALEFGRVDEGQPEEAWAAVSEQFGYLFDGDRCVGFKVLGLSAFNLDTPAHEPIWSGPRFDAPTLALTGATAGEIVLAARTQFKGRSSINRLYFNEAINAETTSDALAEWLGCVETGDSMAHYGLGVALFEAGELTRAYTHLRFYSSIAPNEPWAQYWYARAAVAIEEPGEATPALERVLELSSDQNLIDMAVTLRAEIADGR
jgi:tetratricopeptide (TPR) repeat protein